MRHLFLGVTAQERGSTFEGMIAAPQRSFADKSSEEYSSVHLLIKFSIISGFSMIVLHKGYICCCGVTIICYFIIAKVKYKTSIIKNTNGNKRDYLLFI